ncbi:Uncharacterised protein [Lysinibacillus sphaericus]|uniref:Uncharacterized protein n=1 Tax=Lysinibacillus sphaericus TaxID=1421 RepID=A0AAJ5D9V3_LYSSH|nr:Uncharacterised protein [Lysinibacillus sphaericus]
MFDDEKRLERGTNKKAIDSFSRSTKISIAFVEHNVLSIMLVVFLINLEFLLTVLLLHLAKVSVPLQPLPLFF